MIYRIKISQTISRTIAIEAASPTDALRMAKNKFSDGALGACKVEECYAQIIGKEKTDSSLCATMG